MPRKKDPRRGEAQKKYLESGGKVTIAQLAKEIGVPNTRISKWKCEDKWEELLKGQPRKRGGQPGNQNAAGQTPAKRGNRNAVTHGAYVNANERDIPPDKVAAIRQQAGGSMERINEELQALLIRKAYLEGQLKKYTEDTPNDFHIDKVVHMVVPKSLEDLQAEEDAGIEAGEAIDPEANEATGQKAGTEKMKTAMKSIIKSSSFDRAMKIEAELNKLHGRILKAIDSLKSYELEDRRIQIEERRLNIARQKLTGEIETDMEEETIIDDLADDD